MVGMAVFIVCLRAKVRGGCAPSELDSSAILEYNSCKASSQLLMPGEASPPTEHGNGPSTGRWCRQVAP